MPKAIAVHIGGKRLMSNTATLARQTNDFECSSDQLLKVVLAFNNEADYVNLLNVLLTNIMELTCSDAATLYMLEGNKLHFRILKNNTLNIFKIFDPLDDEVYLPPITLDKENIDNVSAYCAIHNEIVLEDDVYSSNRFNFSGPKNYDKLTGYKTRSMLVLPLVSSSEEEIQEVLGVIQLLNSKNPKTGKHVPYGDISTPPVILALSKIAANTLANLTHIQEIHQLFHSFVEVMTQAIDERSPFTKNHTQKVSIYCAAFAEYLGNTFPLGHHYHFTKKRKDWLVMAALLHDIGKIVTPMHIMDKSTKLFSWQFDSIRDRFEIKKHQLEIDCLSGRITKEEWSTKLFELNNYFSLIEIAMNPRPITPEQRVMINEMANITYRDYKGNEVPILSSCDIASITIQHGTLTDNEREVIQDHVSATGRLLDKITSWKYYKDVSKWAKDHHEFLDGSGYPNGLKGNELCLETCIITITDIFDALTAADRPYRKNMPVSKALDVLHNMAHEGKLHKELVELFTKSNIWEGIIR